MASSPAPRPTRRRTAADARLADTRRRIMSAALTVSAAQGYANATVDEIAATAQVSRTTFYAHFASKAVLIEAIMRAGTPESREHFARLDRLGTPSRAQVQAWIEETVSYWQCHGVHIDIMRQAMASEPSLGSLMVELVNETLEGMPGFLSRYPGGFEAARLRATALVLQLEQFCFFWLVRGAAYDHRASVALLTDIWFEAFGAPNS